MYLSLSFFFFTGVLKLKTVQNCVIVPSCLQ